MRYVLHCYDASSLCASISSQQNPPNINPNQPTSTITPNQPHLQSNLLGQLRTTNAMLHYTTQHFATLYNTHHIDATTATHDYEIKALEVMNDRKTSTNVHCYTMFICTGFQSVPMHIALLPSFFYNSFSQKPKKLAFLALSFGWLLCFEQAGIQNGKQARLKINTNISLTANSNMLQVSPHLST